MNQERCMQQLLLNYALSKGRMPNIYIQAAYLTQGAEVVRNPVQKNALDGATDGEG